MSIFLNRLAQDARLIFVLLISNIFLFICCMVSLGALYQAPSKLTIYLPPDLSNGSFLLKDEIPLPYIYEFALMIWQLLNDWPLGGDRDAIQTLNEYRFYLEPSFYQELLRQYQTLLEKGELVNRVRQLRLQAGAHLDMSKVQVKNATTWELDLPLQLTEFVNGVAVKDKHLVFPLIISRIEIDRERNPFGLVLAGLSNAPYPVVGESHV